MKKKNIALFDNSYEEAKDFIIGLEEATNEEWIPLVCKSNKGRKGLYNIKRYFAYFIFPFLIFMKRGKYKNIIGWQAFYGFNFAFFCRLFKVKKNFTIIIKNFTYKPKKGLISTIYEKYMNFVVNSDYIDFYVCTSNRMVDYCSKRFPNKAQQFIYVPFGVEDFTYKVDNNKIASNDYVLALGRSNRDWDFLINAFTNINNKLIIICDNLHKKNLPSNIVILNNVWGDKTYEYIYNCKFMIIPILDGNIASGETVLLKSFSFSKPVIITEPSCLATDYVINKYNGIIVKKDISDFIKAIKQLNNDNQLYEKMCSNCRKIYEEKYSLISYGRKIGKLVNLDNTR